MPSDPVDIRGPVPHSLLQKTRPQFVPNYTLDEEQTALLQQLRTSVDAMELSPTEREFCDDPCLCRYLRARDWNVEKAENQLLATLKWRKEFKIEQLHPDMFQVEAATGKMYRNGFDKFGRPVIYMKPRLENTKDYENQVRYLVYTLETTIASMDASRGVESWVFIMDFNGHNLSNAVPLSTARQIIEIITTCYPERLGLSIMVDAPMIFSFFWTAISPFIPPVTKQKIKFCSGSSKKGSQKCNLFQDIFDDFSNLEMEYGGETNFRYNHQMYWNNEREIFQTSCLEKDSS